jgi:predicted dehydrogenase
LCIDLADAAPAQVTATILHAERVPEGEGEVVQLDLEFPSRINATITVGNLLETPSRYFCAVCEQGELIFDDLAADTLIRRTKSGETALSVRDSLPLYNALETFVRCIAGENYPAFGLERALEVTRTIAAAEQQLEPMVQTS